MMTVLSERLDIFTKMSCRENNINLVVLVLTLAVSGCFSENIVETKYGKIQGKLSQLEGAPFTSFHSIPYAAPPVNELRFQPPQTHEGWGDDTYDATEYRAACPQAPGIDFEAPLFPERLIKPMREIETEDCLNLDIYIPGDVGSDLLPVIVFIHGGGFLIGASPFQIGDAFVTQDKPVVMVAIQYRLGMLGFMTSGDDVLPGNLGFKDQNFALKWVQENIKAFGGDPDQVTICGESAGGESIIAHMISPMSAGLFKRASSQSPPPTWIYAENSALAKQYQKYATEMKCESDSNQEILDCLRQKSWQELYNITDVMLLMSLSQRVIDGEFITIEPRQAWKEGKYNQVEDFMIGITSDDGILALEYFLSPEFLTNRSQDEMIARSLPSVILPFALGDDFFTPTEVFTRKGKPMTNLAEIATMIKARYYDSQDTVKEKARGLLDAGRDMFFLFTGFAAAHEMATRGDSVHAYIFDHRTSLYTDLGEDGIKVGAPHASELPFQFCFGLTHPEEAVMTEEELTLCKSVIHAWTSFVVGKPEYKDMSGNVIQWQPFTKDEKNVLTFDTKMSEVSVQESSSTWQASLDFWLAIDSLARFEDEEAESEVEKKRDEL